jgi:hypothetical protein
MGVLACDRAGCENIMCDILVDNQYVCNKCANEFRSLMGDGSTTLREMGLAFDSFMDSKKPNYVSDVIVNVDEFLRPMGR